MGPSIGNKVLQRSVYEEQPEIGMQKQRRAFTLIEVLVVIAVIAILSALIFPAFTRARAEAYRSGDLSSMNALRGAILLYREDQGGFPPQILGYASLYSSGPDAGAVVPANRIASYLYPRRVSSIETLRPSQNRVGLTDVTMATWPNADPRTLGTAAQYDLNGDGLIDLVQDDPALARQAFGPGAGCVTTGLGVDATCNEGAGSALFYTVSGYDVSRNPYQNPGNAAFPQHELRYALFWTVAGLGAGSEQDDPRQLGYNNPPDSTIITWNSWWRDYETGNVIAGIPVQPVGGRRDMVLTVGGAARTADSKALFARSWRYVP